MKKRINYEAKSPNSSRDYFGLDVAGNKNFT